MSDTAQAKASKKYMSKTKKPQVVLNLDNEVERKIFEATNKDEMSFSELCKMLLARHYGIENNSKKIDGV